MSTTLTARWAGALPAILGLLVGACGTAGGPRVGSQTNWLRACQTDAECGELDCLCGACTRSCDTDTSCADLPDASEYTIEVAASPTWMVPADDRVFTVSLSMIRLVPME